jgi:multiple sugar transport system substrate-binding protein
VNKRPIAALLAAGLAGAVSGLGGFATASAHAAPNAKPYAGQTINVVFSSNPPPPAMLEQFTKETGIHVKWTTVQWDNLQTKIVSAMSAHVYFADVTDVDWSRVGLYYHTHWFVPLNRYFNIGALVKSIPQLSSFEDHGQLVGVPVDSSFMVTTVNTKDFAKAGITKMPTTIAQYTQDLRILKQKGVSAHPLGIPLAAAEGLSTYWYEVTGAFGGSLLSASFQPLFTSPSSPGYKAMEWIVNAYKQGLVPPGNLDIIDQQEQEGEMAHNQVATIFSDYSGNVGTIYDVPADSSVVNQVQYIPTPGINGIGPNLGNPDGMGIPVTARHVGAAVAFLKWFDNPTNQAIWSGLDGPQKAIEGWPTPIYVSSMEMLIKAHRLDQGPMLVNLLEHHARPVFPEGAPPWYPQWSNAVYTNIHEAAAGQETVAQAIHNIAATVNSLRG